MNYRHAFHAGNFADVAKHLALISLMQHLRRRDTPFAVIDTHAGRGLYDLVGEEARRTRESACGVDRLRGFHSTLPALSTYLELTRDSRAYPGSPLIAARLLRPRDRLVAIERNPEEAAALALALRSFGKTRIACADGYERLPALLPPPERRAAILIDPPYEAEDEFAQTAAAFAAAYRRFATGHYLIWFPVKSVAEADGFCGEILARGVGKASRVDVWIGSGAGPRLERAGLLVVNPPYRFDEEMHRALDIVMPLLGGGLRIDRLAGD